MNTQIQLTEASAFDDEYRGWLADPDAQLEYQLWATNQDLKTLLQKVNHDH